MVCLPRLIIPFLEVGSLAHGSGYARLACLENEFRSGIASAKRRSIKIARFNGDQRLTRYFRLDACTTQGEGRLCPYSFRCILSVEFSRMLFARVLYCSYLP